MRIPALLLLLLIWFAAAGTTALGDEPPAAYGKVDLQVSPLLTRFIEQRQGAESQSRQQPSGVVSSRSQSGDSIDKSASSAEDPASTETADDPVRFDSSGNLQVYIHLDNTDEETLQQLRDLGAASRSSTRTGKSCRPGRPSRPWTRLRHWTRCRRSHPRTMA